MKKLFFSLLFLIATTSLWAQIPLEVAGQVTTDGTNPVVGQIVQIYYNNFNGSNSYDSVLTDASGNYSQIYTPTNTQGGVVYTTLYDCQGNLLADSTFFSQNDTLFISNFITCPNGACQASFNVSFLGSQAYQFFSTSSGSTPMGPITHQWDLGDGNTSMATNPTHTYTNPGTYTITLIINDTLGNCSDTTSTTLTVTQATCDAAFGWNANGLTVDFFNFSNTTGPATYQWWFGDGNSSSLMNPTHTYAVDSSYDVSLVILNGSCTDTITQSVSVFSNTLCSPGFTNLINGLDVSFFSIADSLGCTGVSYDWDFGDGATSTQPSPFHTYPAQGSYHACLTLYDSASMTSSTWCDTLEVGGCVVNFSFMPDSFNANTIEFYPYLNNPNPNAAYSWSFGDGNTSMDTYPIHTYASPDTYIVCVHVAIFTGGNMCTDSICMPVLVGGGGPIGCQASFGYNANALTVDFFNSSTPGSYQWDFGDGSVGSTATNPQHTFPVDSSYWVSLIVTDSFCSDTIGQWITVSTQQNCPALFVANANGLAVDFIALADSLGCTGIFYDWSFGDGNVGSGPYVSHTYGADGTYNVCLTLSDSAGNLLDTMCAPLTIVTGTPPVCDASFSYYPDSFLTNIIHFLPSQFNPIVGGTYEWTFGDGNSSSDPFPVHTYSNSGTYTVCLILTVSTATGACSDTVCSTLTVTTNPNGMFISGWVFADSMPTFDGLVYLIQHDSATGTLTAIDSVQILQSSYTFVNVNPGSYLVKAALDSADASYATSLPTYFGDELFWYNATSTVVTNSSVSLPPINLVQGTNPGGPGFIGGLVSQGANKNGDPLMNMDIILTTIDDIPVMATRTHEDGTYDLPSLAYGTYKVYVEVPGRYGNPQIVTISADNPSVTDIDFEVNSNSIVATALEDVLQLTGMAAFPNPTMDQVTIEWFMAQPAKVNLRVRNTLGQTIRQLAVSTSSGKQQQTVNLQGLPAGMYLVELGLGDKRCSLRVMKQN